MPQSWGDYPIAVTFVLLLSVVTLRAQGTYWLARTVRAAALRGDLRPESWRARVDAWLDRRVSGHGTDIVKRFGLVVIPLAHLTVGLQTVVLAAAGLLRITWWQFSLAQLLGGLAWAGIYTTVGFAVWWAAVSATLGHWWLAVLLIAGVGTVLVVRRRRAALHSLSAASG